MQKFHLLFG